MMQPANIGADMMAQAHMLIVPIERHTEKDLPRPVCSEAGCQEPARYWYGAYANADAQQGEHSQVKGWFFCHLHLGLFRGRERAGELGRLVRERAQQQRQQQGA